MPCMDSAVTAADPPGFVTLGDEDALFCSFIFDTTAGFRVGLGAAGAFVTGFAVGSAFLGAGLGGVVIPGILEWSMPCIDCA